MKALLTEFKEFISRGNVIDLAVGVIIGGAFTTIVNSLVNDIVMPLISILLGTVNFISLQVTIGSAVIPYGHFIQAVVNFLLTAAAVFAMIKIINAFHRKKEEEPEAEKPSEPSEEILLLREIRDSLKK